MPRSAMRRAQQSGWTKAEGLRRELGEVLGLEVEGITDFRTAEKSYGGQYHKVLIQSDYLPATGFRS